MGLGAGFPNPGKPALSRLIRWIEKVSREYLWGVLLCALKAR